MKTVAKTRKAISLGVREVFAMALSPDEGKLSSVNKPVNKRTNNAHGLAPMGSQAEVERTYSNLS